MIEEFIDNQTKAISKVYKMPEAEIKQTLLRLLDKEGSLIDLIENMQNPKIIAKNRRVRLWLKKAKKDIYYKLRTYQSSDDLSPLSHISTKERQPYIESFISQLRPYLSQTRTVLDLGGGMFPITFPFDQFSNIERFVWVDKDKKSYEKLKWAFSDRPHIPIEFYNHHLGTRPWTIYLEPKKNRFDLVFMLKLIPAVHRQEENLLPHLASLPADFVVITGNKESMTKMKNVQKREGRILQDFISMTGKKIAGRLEIENEFGFVLS